GAGSGHAADPGQDAGIEWVAQLDGVADRTEPRARAGDVDARNIGVERLDLEPVDRDDGMTVVHEVMGEREARGPEPHNENLAAGRGLRERPKQIERLRPRQQPEELEAPRAGH